MHLAAGHSPRPNSQTPHLVYRQVYEFEVHVSAEDEPLPSMLWPEEGVQHYINLLSSSPATIAASPHSTPETHLTINHQLLTMDLGFSYTPPAIPIEIFRSFYSEERCVYSRLVFDLAMDPGLSMDVVAFWLWLQDNGQPNTIQRLNLLKDGGALRSIAEVAQSFVLALRRQPPPSPEVARLLPTPDLSDVVFHRAALKGVTYFLEKVCIKALSDIRTKAEELANANMQMLVQNMARAHLIEANLADHTAARAMLPPSQDLLGRPYVPHGEGTSRGSGQARMDWAAAAMAAKSGNPFLIFLGAGQGTDQLPLHDFMTEIKAPPQAVVGVGAPMGNNSVNKKETYFTPPGYRCTCFPPEPFIPIEERMLFVTFSNGYPFAPKELHSFFMRYTP